MKKVFALIALAAVFAACNNAAETAEATTTEAAATIDSAANSIDSTVKAATDSLAAKVDSLKK